MADDVNNPGNQVPAADASVIDPSANSNPTDPASSQLSGLEDAVDAAKQALDQVPPQPQNPSSTSPTDEFQKVFGSDSSAPAAAPPAEEVPAVAPDVSKLTDASNFSSQGASGLSETQEKDLAEKLKQKIDEDVDQILTGTAEDKPAT